METHETQFRKWYFLLKESTIRIYLLEIFIIYHFFVIWSDFIVRFPKEVWDEGDAQAHVIVNREQKRIHSK